MKPAIALSLVAVLCIPVLPCVARGQPQIPVHGNSSDWLKYFNEDEAYRKTEKRAEEQVTAAKEQAAAAKEQADWQMYGVFGVVALVLLFGLVAVGSLLRRQNGSEQAAGPSTAENRRLTPCPDCGRMVSTIAAARPQCGRPLSEQSNECVGKTNGPRNEKHRSSADATEMA